MGIVVCWRLGCSREIHFRGTPHPSRVAPGKPQLLPLLYNFPGGRTHKLYIPGVCCFQKPAFRMLNRAEARKRGAGAKTKTHNTKTTMKTKIALTLGLALAVSALTVSAQPGYGRGVRRGGPGGPGADGFGPPFPSACMAALDSNKDGVLSAEEIANAPAALATLDKNHDGQITPDEWRGLGRGRFWGPGMAGGRGPRGRGWGANAGQPAGPPGPPPVVAALDANHDGVIDAQEIANAPAALLTLDKNHDGQLTRDEIRPPWAGPNGPRGPRGWRGGPPGDGPGTPPPADQ